MFVFEMKRYTLKIVLPKLKERKFWLDEKSKTLKLEDVNIRIDHVLLDSSVPASP